MKVLILDDEDAICTFLADVATAVGWTAEKTNCKLDFRAQFSRSLPDAVVLDLHLGETDGISEMRFLADHRYQGPLGLMSGFDHRVLSSAQQIGTSLGLQVVDVLEKPIRAATARKLLAIFERLLAKPDVEHAHNGVPRSATNILTSAAVDLALERSEMELYYQPIVSAADTTTACHVEALIRWNHAVLGLVMPSAFIPMAETNQATIDRLTDWVLSAAATHVRALHDVGLPIPIAVNVSGANLQSVDYPEHVKALLGSGFEPGSLIFEVTESVAARGPNAADILTRLRLKGFELSIDDFGTGYSSLEALRRIPFSSIKVDQTFVAGLPWSKDSLAIVKSVIALARSMDLESIAEGVETRELADQLIELGIDQLQGYYYSRPLPFPQLVPWLEDRSSRGLGTDAKPA